MGHVKPTSTNTEVLLKQNVGPLITLILNSSAPLTDVAEIAGSVLSYLVRYLQHCNWKQHFCTFPCS